MLFPLTNPLALVLATVVLAIPTAVFVVLSLRLRHFLPFSAQYRADADRLANLIGARRFVLAPRAALLPSFAVGILGFSLLSARWGSSSEWVDFPLPVALIAAAAVAAASSVEQTAVEDRARALLAALEGGSDDPEIGD